MPKLSLGFGVERIGFLALKFPILSFALLAAFTLFSVHGIQKIEINPKISNVFNSTDAIYQRYDWLRKNFSVGENDIFLIVQSDRVLARRSLEKLRLMQLDLQLLDSVQSILSVFSVRKPVDASGEAPALVPSTLPSGAAFDALVATLLADPQVAGTFVSKPALGPARALFVISIDPKSYDALGVHEIVDEIQRTADQILSDTDIDIGLTGVPVMHKDMIDGIERDQIVFNGVGFAISLALALLFFRRLTTCVVVIAPPVMAVIWALGVLGHWGQDINLFVNMIPPLVMILAFCDAMHMVAAITDRLRRGDDRRAAIRHAIQTIGPACVLTSVTTAGALLCVTVTDLQVFRDFGVAAAAATLTAYLSVMTVVPLASLVLMRAEPVKAGRTGFAGISGPMSALDRASRHLALWLRRNHVAAVTVAVLAGVAFTTLHLQLEPRFRLIDQIPANKPSIAASGSLDEALGGTYPLHVLVRWRSGSSVESETVSKAIEQAHAELAATPFVGATSSIVTLRDWLDRSPYADRSTLGAHLAELPEHHRRRLVGADGLSALVSGRLPNLEAGETAAVIRDLDRRLEPLRQAYPEISFSVTGISTILSTLATVMIGQLNMGLLTAIAGGVVLIGVAFRSWRAALLSVLPNLLPVVTAGTVLYLTGLGLQFASVIALTVAFGLAVDDTIHFLSRARSELARPQATASALFRSVIEVGPVLMLTTLIIVGGIAGMLFSDFFASRLIGGLVILSMLVALIGDLVVLPSLMLVLRRAGGFAGSTRR